MFVVHQDAQGNETLEPPAGGSVALGDVLDYRFLYRNTDFAPVSVVVLNGPIPEGTRYVGASADCKTRCRRGSSM